MTLTSPGHSIDEPHTISALDTGTLAPQNVNMRPSTSASLLFIAAIATTASALPTTSSDIVARAGGPAAVPIPSSCVVTNPLPTTDSVSYQPAPATDVDRTYHVYYPSFSTNKTMMAQQCLEQCYGLGGPPGCKAAFWAENIVVPAGYYGTPGGQLSTGCIMFQRPLESTDFVPAPAGQATDAFAGNILC